MAYDIPDDQNAGAAAGIGGIGGAIPGLNIIAPGIASMLSGAGSQRAWQDAANNAANIPLPQFSNQSFQAPNYAGDFNPAMYQTPEQAQATTISTDPATRNIQMQALQQLISAGNGSADAQQQAAQFKALDAANQMANAREGAIRQDMESRGQGGNEMNAIMRAQAAQMGANRAQSGTLDAQSQAALQKLAALQYAGNAAGAVRGQDLGQASANADILNRFNLFNTQANNAANQGNVNTQNQAGMFNLGNRQGIMNAQAGARNATLGRSDQNQMSTFGANAQRTGMVNSALSGLAGNYKTANDEGLQAGKTGYGNFKDLMSFAGGG